MATILLVLIGLTCFGLGITGTLYPQVTRRLISVFVHRSPTRLLGGIVLVAGGLLFYYADSSAVPALGKVIGLVMFVAGGTQLMIPDLAIVFNEWWVEQRPLYERGVSVVYLAVAAFLIVSASPSRVVDAAAAHLEPVYREVADSYSLVFGRSPAKERRAVSPEAREKMRKMLEEAGQTADSDPEREAHIPPAPGEQSAL